MALIGLSLIVASVVYVIIRPPSWLPPALLSWLPRSSTAAAAITDARRPDKKSPSSPPPAPTIIEPCEMDRAAMSPPPVPTIAEPCEDRAAMPPPVPTIAEPCEDRAAMPPPPPPPPQPPKSVVVQPPSIAVEPDKQPESPTTPKAAAAQLPPPPPTFSLSTDSMPPPPRPNPSTSSSLSSSSASSMMPPPPPPPPPPPSRLSAADPRPPTLGHFPAANSAQRARAPILPDRGGPRSSSLAPPPTHTTSVPTKPSRQMMTLEPGHSPLDWARLSGGPGADLRGVPAATPYLRVTPSMLRRQTGRRGTDAWMALGGKVYNVTPYAKFHPGGVPELMRGAARDGTRLFGEVHPWVNYENMLTACLVGILVEEPGPAGGGGGGHPQSDMEAMD